MSRACQCTCRGRDCCELAWGHKKCRGKIKRISKSLRICFYFFRYEDLWHCAKIRREKMTNCHNLDLGEYVEGSSAFSRQKAKSTGREGPWPWPGVLGLESTEPLIKQPLGCWLRGPNMQNYSAISFLKIPSKSNRINRLQNISGLHHVLSTFHVYSCFMIGLVCLLDITRPSPGRDAAAFPWTPGVCFFKCPTQPVATVACSEKLPLTAAGWQHKPHPISMVSAINIIIIYI